jgi:hypothetical protein
MGRIELNRLRKKYNYTSGEYKKLVQRIILDNSTAIQNKVSKISEEDLSKAAKRIATKEKKMIIPKDLKVPRGLNVKKAVERGTLMTDELRNRISSKLRKSLNQFTPKTGETTFVRRRGKKAGTINPKLISEFENDIIGVFENYTRKDSKYGVPSNVHSIAVTEFRSAVNEMKFRYMSTFMDNNPGFQVRKEWIHNKSLSKKPREHHMAMNKRSVSFNESFILSNGVVLRYPHDPEAPVKEVISCNCDYQIYINRL